MRKLLLMVAVALLWHAGVMAQEPLFKYPVAPDTCSTLESRCDYIVTNFWENYDLEKETDLTRSGLITLSPSCWPELMSWGR